MRNLALLWPWALLLLLLFPWLILWYRSTVRLGGSRAHAAYPSASLIALAAPTARPWQHLPVTFYTIALVIAVLALARPTAEILVPDNLSGVMLAIETSSSMRSGDIAPTRLAATQEAAKALLQTIPANTKVGLATFSGYGTVNVPPTTDRARVLKAIDALSIGGSYAFSHGLIASLDALPEKSPEEVTPGAIVLFSHGHDNTANDPLAIAGKAADRGIKIHTVGVGTHGNNFSDDVLKLVADRTGGRYYPIFSATDLQDAHHDLGRIIALKPRTTEITSGISLMAALLLAVSLGLAHVRRRVV
ncbi:MAG: VWA domain-containing protein [Anaerolineae bacterium]|nr:VWA domain-containing protein [Anaerolineae bacterium]